MDPESISLNPPEALARVDEAELIERVRSGDMSAARQLYDVYVGDVHRLALRMTADHALAESSKSIKLRKDAIWYLAQSRDSRALALFEKLLAGR